ncbi:MAG TPA: FUSC family protein [Cellulomonas sp.]
MSATGTTRAEGEPGFRRSARVLLEARFRQGRARVRSSWYPIVQAAVAVAVSAAIGRYALGHQYPFFAPVAAWVCLGFSADRKIRKVAELAVGVALGVGLGDVVVRLIGSGPWQVALVLLVAATTARFLDRGVTFTTQAGVQALVIVGLPSLGASGGGFGRWTDAAVGGAVALAVTALTPSDPRRPVRAQSRAVTIELVGMLRTLARGLRTRTVQDVEDALVRGRASQPALDDWHDGAANARELARVSPAWRRHRAEIGALGQSAVLVDRAMRNARVLARRSRSIVAAETTHELLGVATAVDDLARGTDALGTAMMTGATPTQARTELLAVTRRLDPFVLAPDDWLVQSLVLLLRSLAVDLLEAAGVSPTEARAALPEL